MSAIVLLPIIIPAATAAWPTVLTAATAAATLLGYSSVRGKSKVKEEVEATLEVEHCEAVTDGLALGETLVFVKDNVQITFLRDTRGKVVVKVSGHGKSEAELKALGRQFSQGVVQQYAYHRLMTELRSRNFNVVQEQVEEDGTVRMHVRTYQG